MATDKRAKGCPNPSCENHIKKVKIKASDDFCPKCGEPLIFVCKKCFCEIQDLGMEHTKCTHCMEEAQAKKEQRIEMAKDYGKKAAVAVGGVIVAVGGTVGKAVLNKSTNEIAKVAVQKAEKVVKAVVK